MLNVKHFSLMAAFNIHISLFLNMPNKDYE